MKNMYKDVKYAIKFADGETCMFSSKVGVKQGVLYNFPSIIPDRYLILKWY
jgi:hypothetical protein